MALHRLTFLLFLLCAVVLTGTITAVYGAPAKANVVRIGVFNSQAQAQNFFETLPVGFREKIAPSQLWLSVFEAPSGLMHHNLEISALDQTLAKDICAFTKDRSYQCINAVKVQLPAPPHPLLTGGALDTRRKRAFSNLDSINPAPPDLTNAAPFVTAVPALISGPQFTGDHADIELRFSQAVSVSGTPQLSGFIDANPRVFTYNEGESAPTKLVFRYTFTAADAGSAGITINGFSLNGGALNGTLNTLEALTTFTDTVLVISDLSKPQLTSSLPVNGDLLFSAADNIVLTFNEDVQANTGNIIIRDTNDDTGTRIIPVGDPQVTIAGNIVTIDPSAVLEQGETYEVVMGGNIIQDLAGNAYDGLASDDLTFTTDIDVTGPVLQSATPADNATGIARNTAITITFDEDISLAGTVNLVDIDDGTGSIAYTSASPQVNIIDNVMTITPASSLEYAENYELTWLAGAIVDPFGNQVAALNSGDLNFKTVDLEETLTLSLNIAADDNIDEGNVQSSGVSIDRDGTFVVAMDINIPASPSGLIFECGGAGQGQFVGFNTGDGVLRVRGGDGGQPPPNTGMASFDVPIANIPSGDFTFMFEYEFATTRIRAWLDETLLGSATALGGSLESNNWSGGDNCAFIVSSASAVPNNETDVGFNGSLNDPDIRYYRNQTVP